jgi:Thioesterase-like superfamily
VSVADGEAQRAAAADAAGDDHAGASIFRSQGERFVATEHARGPWDPRALHGGAAAALLTAAFERLQPGAEMAIARLGFELLRPIPFAPLSLSLAIVRRGRRVQELAGELRCEERTIVRASALRVQPVPTGLPDPDDRAARAAWTQRPMPPPQEGMPVRFALDGEPTSFAATAMEMRWLSEPGKPGPGRVWMRLRHPLLAGEPLSPLARLAATADFGNGISAALPFERFLFINADLTVHLWRRPRGEWIGLDARTLLHGGSGGLAESVLHDLDGPVGRAFQSLVVEPR